MRLGVRAALVGGAEVPGDVEVENGRIAAVGLSPAGAAELAVPGFVDLQVNGFAGPTSWRPLRATTEPPEAPWRQPA